eukprot:SAG11_NODE_1506_length_4781_cov_2.355831_4_plen_48_part_00
MEDFYFYCLPPAPRPRALRILISRTAHDMVFARETSKVLKDLFTMDQ